MLPYLSSVRSLSSQADDDYSDGSDNEHHGGEVCEVDLGHDVRTCVGMTTLRSRIDEVQNHSNQTHHLPDQHTPERSLQC